MSLRARILLAMGLIIALVVVAGVGGVRRLGAHHSTPFR